MKKPAPPAGLSAAARAWWRRLVNDFGIEDSAGLLLLQTAMRAFDRMQDAATLIRRDGVVIDDRFKQKKPHPAAQIERDARAGMITALRALRLKET